MREYDIETVVSVWYVQRASDLQIADRQVTDRGAHANPRDGLGRDIKARPAGAPTNQLFGVRALAQTYFQHLFALEIKMIEPA